MTGKKEDEVYEDSGEEQDLLSSLNGIQIPIDEGGSPIKRNIKYPQRSISKMIMKAKMDAKNTVKQIFKPPTPVAKNVSFNLQKVNPETSKTRLPLIRCSMAPEKS